MDLIPSNAPALEAQNDEVPGEDNVQSLRARISLLEGDITELQRNAAAQEATAQRAVASDGFMLAELEKALEQLLCKHPRTSSAAFYGAA